MPPDTSIGSTSIGSTAAPPAPVSTSREWQHKHELEAALAARPDDAGLRAAYFDHLMLIASRRSGLLWAFLPELGHPIYFRAGTPDVTVLAHVFRDGAMDWEMAATPSTIVVIGAHVGFAALDLARRHRQAQVLCVEPGGDNVRLLMANITPSRRIRAIQAAAWHSPTRLGPHPRIQGDMIIRYADDPLPTDRAVGGLPIADLMARAGWSEADLVVCDTCGAEREIFADPHAAWLRTTDAVMVRCYDNLTPGSSGAVSACFPTAAFEHRKVRDADLFVRRTPLRSLPRDTPVALSLIQSEPADAPLILEDILPAAFGFYVFEGNCCQLHPGVPGAPPARAVFPVTLSGHRRFSAGILHAGATAAPIVFSVVLETSDGTEIARTEQTISAGQSGRLTLFLPEPHGPHRVALQTEMPPDAANNYNAWARWIDPRVA